MNELTTTITMAMTPFVAGIIDIVTEQVMARIKKETESKEPRYYTAKQVANLMHVSLPTVRRMSKRGDIIPLKLPNVRGIRYDAEIVDSLLSKKIIYRYKHSK